MALLCRHPPPQSLTHPSTHTPVSTHQATHVAEHGVGADKGVAGNGLAEHLHAQRVRNNVLRLSVNVRVHQGHVVVARNDVAQGGQALLNSSHL